MRHSQESGPEPAVASCWHVSLWSSMTVPLLRQTSHPPVWVIRSTRKQVIYMSDTKPALTQHHHHHHQPPPALPRHRQHQSCSNWVCGCCSPSTLSQTEMTSCVCNSRPRCYWMFLCSSLPYVQMWPEPREALKLILRGISRLRKSGMI